jgi:hypothetical protein
LLIGAGALVALSWGVMGSPAGIAEAAPAVAPLAPLPIQPAPDGCRSLPVDADPAIKSAIARSSYGVDGTGVTIGILSTSFDTDASAASHAADDIAAGLLPGVGNPCGRLDPVEVLPIPSTLTGDEGRGMAQLVHGVAPGAHIVFAPGGTVAGSAASVVALQKAGADIIVDDMVILDEPYYQQSALAVAIDSVVDAGIVYLTAAGNENLLGAEGYPSAGLPIGSWSTEAYRWTDCPEGVGEASVLPGPWDCMDFDQGVAADATDTLTLAGTSDPTKPTWLPLYLQWAESQNTALRGSFNLVADYGSSRTAGQVGGNATPSTAIGLQNAGTAPLDVDVSIVRSTAGGPSSEIEPAMKFLGYTDGEQVLLNAEYHSSQGGDTVGPTIFGHNGTPSAITVGAAPFIAPTRLEEFSSFGPVTYYFGPVTPSGAEPLAAPQTFSKPDIVSVDRERTSFIEPEDMYVPGQYLFPGTSAATPVAGAVVALGLELRPDLSPAQVRAALTGTATPLAPQYPDFSSEQVAGSGLIDAEAFLGAVQTIPVPEPASRPAASGTPVLASTGWVPGVPLALAVASLVLGAIVVRRRRGALR